MIQNKSKAAKLAAKRKSIKRKRSLGERKCATVKYLVVHSTGTKMNMPIKDLDGLTYHFIVTPGGKLLCLKPVGRSERRIHIAWVGGLDKEGNHVDNRTDKQKETLFTALVMLAEQFSKAEITAADELYPYGYANPGFDLKEWLANYLPSILFAAI